MKRLLALSLSIAILINFSFAIAAHHEKMMPKPAILEGIQATLEAEVEAVDYQTRMVTLKKSDGTNVTINVQPDVANLEEVVVGDHVTINYLETVSIEVFSPDTAQPAAARLETMENTEARKKPGGMRVEKTVVVATIENIDLENQLATLHFPNGESKTVVPQNPENLKRVEVGDRVVISHTAIMAHKVTEKQ